MRVNAYIIFVHFNIDYYGLLESDIYLYVCTCMWTAFTQMSLVTAVNEYTLGFTHTSNCPTISNVKVCLILYNTLVLLVQIYSYVRTYVSNLILYSRKSCVYCFTTYRILNTHT